MKTTLIALVISASVFGCSTVHMLPNGIIINGEPIRISSPPHATSLQYAADSFIKDVYGEE